MAYEITVASADDARRMAQWAGDEGWNPGNTDIHAFFATDPGGFLVGRLDGEPVTCISVVKYGARLRLPRLLHRPAVGARQRLRHPDLARRHDAAGRPQCRARRRAGAAGELPQVGLPAGLEQHPLRRPAACRQAAGRRQPGRCAERAVRPARRLRPPVLLRGPRQFPGSLDHAARARGHGGRCATASLQVLPSCGRAARPRASGRCSPSQQTSPKPWSRRWPTGRAPRRWRSTCRTSTSPASRWSSGPA